ncbi:MAG: S46 family peptidase [Planctomycetota bacterium]|jgi:hypothetical protein
MKLPHKMLILATLLATALPAQKDLEMGKMWTLENPPLAYLEKEYGFKPDRKWLNSLQLASIRFGSGCSSSFVSPKGLILTNHHCVRGNIAKVQADAEWDKNGFYATSLTDEVKLPGLNVQQLLSTEDVTAKLNEGIEEGDDDAAIDRQRRQNQAKLIAKTTAGREGIQAEVVKLYQGAVFQLYTYKIYRDVRLVCSPHLQTAFFGGDPDNFTYPRYCLDFAFCRAYENDKPADTSKHYFKWSKTGAKEGELVFTTGCPGSTGRLLTKAQLEYTRDAFHPLVLGMLDAEVDVIGKHAKADPEYEKKQRTRFFGRQNAQKAYRGYQSGLLDKQLMAQKTAAEAEFRKKVNDDEKLKAKYAPAWDKLAEVAAEMKELYPKLRLQSDYNAPILARAMNIVAALDPETRNPDRAREAALRPLRPKDRTADELFAAHLERARKWLGVNDPYVQAVMGELPAAEAVNRLNKSKVADDEFVAKLLDGGREMLDASTDVALKTARVMLPARRKNVARWRELQAQQNVQGTLIGQALFEVYGNKVSPDATFTLRFSDGVVKGFPFNGTIAPHETTFYGLYGRNCAFNDKPPFNLPKIWMDKKDKIDLSKPVNFVATNDIIGGNSGSPVVNKDLEVVGLIFDGNIEMLPNKFLYTDDVPRSVSVHVVGIMEALKRIYEAERVVAELEGNE